MKGNATLLELRGQQAVRRTYLSGSSRRVLVSREHLLDILFMAEESFGYVSSSTLRLAQRRALDTNGVAVVTQPTQQCFSHRPIP